MRPRYFAIVPAAGQSARMGEPKLLLPLAGSPLITHVLRAWQRSRVGHIVAVIRPGDERLAEVIRTAGIELAIPATPPPDMKASIQTALRHILTRFSPTATDAFLVAPADVPGLSPGVIDALIERHLTGDKSILVPTIAGRRGHPVLFPWPLAAEVHSLSAGDGLDSLVRRQATLTVPCDDVVAGNGINPFADMDTPEDYRRLSE